VAQHGILAEGAHARTVYGFCVGVETGLHHGLRGVPVGHAEALAEAVIESVIQVKDHATDERLLDSARLLPARTWLGILPLLLIGQWHLSGYWQYPF
jgi:hypothetical protein